MNQSWINLAVTLIAGLGIGSVITALIQYSLKRREAAHQSQREVLEARYKVIILLMYAAYDFKSNETAMRINRPNLKNRAQVLEDLRAEWVNALLFASSETLEALRHFISDPTANRLTECATAMRRDLGRSPLSLRNVNLPPLPVPSER